MTAARPDPPPPAGDLADASLVASLRGLARDGRLLFTLRTLRMFGYGFLAVILVLYLAASGLDPVGIGVVLTLTLVGDTVVSLWFTTHADRIGRRRVLVLGSLLVAAAGIVFAVTDWLPLLIVAGVVGVISPTGNEVGPFLAVEQAALTQVVPDRRRTATFAWYNLVGYVATAVGALVAGVLTQMLITGGLAEVDAYRAIVVGYALIGLAMAVTASRLGTTVEVRPSDDAAAEASVRGRLGLGRSRGVVLRLSALFSIDAFAGGFIPQSLMAYWFVLRFDVDPAALGGIFFAANMLAAVSSLSAARIAARIGLINTMVFTHLPSNVLLLLVPLMPTLPLAVAVLLLRFSLSQMDVPTRQSYVMAVVEPGERAAAAGVTGIARTIGASVSPSISSVLVANASVASLPFFLAGGLKILYDLLLYRDFRAHRPPEEVAAAPTPSAHPGSGGA
ncbi:MAG: MFS transporter [Candidatus Limnocylindrales bacterium]